jgi:hypothetical protein
VTAAAPTASAFFSSNASFSSGMHEIACVFEMISMPKQSASNAQPPRYRSQTRLTVPASVLHASWPLVSAIIAENRATPGMFSALAGLPMTWSSGALTNSIALCATEKTGPLAPALRECMPALAALAAAAEVAVATTISFSLSFETQLLLVAPRGGPRLPENFIATVAGVTCRTNWVSYDGMVASILTPTRFELCDALGVSTDADDCGLARFELSGASPTEATLTLLQSARGRFPGEPLLLARNLMPPSRVGENWAAMFAVASSDIDPMTGVPGTPGAFAGLSNPSNVIATEYFSADSELLPGAGVRIMKGCASVTSPGFATPQDCAAAARASINQPPFLCAWGSGDTCTLCPAKARCPGGKVLFPLPGAWLPTAASSPDELLSCPSPDELRRCPGYKNISSSNGVWGCGEGFAGPACASCAKNHFFVANSCTRCPRITGSHFAAAVLPLVYFGIALFGAGVVLVALVTKFLALSPRVAAWAVFELLLFFWSGAQSASAAFSLAQSLSPPRVAPVLTMLSALQISGFTVPSSCIDLPPFLVEFIASGVTLFLVVGAAFAAYCSSLHEGRAQSISIFVILLNFFHSPMVSVLTASLPCLPPSSMAVHSYLSLKNDGTALVAALADPDSAVSRALAGVSATIVEIQRAASDPVFASKQKLSAALSATIRVAVLAKDSDTVCYEGTHAIALPVAICALVLLGLWTAAGIYCAVEAARNLANHAVVAAPNDNAALAVAGSDGAQTQTTTPPEVINLPRCMRVRSALAAALSSNDVKKHAAAFTPTQEFLSALTSVLCAVALVTQDVSVFCGLMGFAIVAQFAFCAGVLRVAPFEEAWKTKAVVLLTALPTLAQLLAIVFLLYNRQSGNARIAQNAGAVAGVSLLIVLAILIVLFILIAWWRALEKKTRQRPPIPNKDERGEEIDYIGNPLYSPQLPAIAGADEKLDTVTGGAADGGALGVGEAELPPTAEEDEETQKFQASTISRATHAMFDAELDVPSRSLRRSPLQPQAILLDFASNYDVGQERPAESPPIPVNVRNFLSKSSFGRYANNAQSSKRMTSTFGNY